MMKDITLGRQQYQRQKLRKASSKIYNYTKFELRAILVIARHLAYAQLMILRIRQKKIEFMNLQHTDS